MPDATLAILFADVAGSTPLYERLGDREAHSRIAACLARAAAATASRGGRVVKTIGDGLMAAFPRGEAAFLAAVAMQEAQAVAGDGLALRVGFHEGPALAQGGDLFGDAVNLAARLGEAAGPGQVLLTAATAAALPAALRVGVRALGALAVKGKSRPVDAAEVVWDTGADLTIVDAAATAPAPAGRALTLALGSHQVRVLPGEGWVTLGRDGGNDLVVPSPRASREHARVEFRGGQFVVVDFSANGTVVRADGGPEVLVRRDSHALRGSGWIVLGGGAGPGEPVRYACG